MHTGVHHVLWNCMDCDFAIISLAVVTCSSSPSFFLCMIGRPASGRGPVPLDLASFTRGSDTLGLVPGRIAPSAFFCPLVLRAQLDVPFEYQGTPISLGDANARRALQLTYSWTRQSPLFCMRVLASTLWVYSCLLLLIRIIKTIHHASCIILHPSSPSA